MDEPAQNWNWTLRFVYKPVDFKLESAGIIPSVWIWFFAGASTAEKALKSREELLKNLRHAVNVQVGR